MGSSSSAPTPTPPAPISAQETSAQAIQAQINALPQILQAQQQYGPGFQQQALTELQQYGPQFAQTALDLQKTYGPQFAEVERSLSPELAGAQDTLKQFLSQTDDQEYNALRPGMIEDVRAAQSQRGIGAFSPLGAIDESVQLQRLRQSLKDRRLNIALSTAGRVPISSVPNIQGQSGVGQLVNNVDPNSIFGYQQSLNNFNASIFGTQSSNYQANMNKPSVMGTVLGSLAGGIGGGLGAGFGYSMAPKIFGGK